MVAQEKAKFNSIITIELHRLVKLFTQRNDAITAKKHGYNFHLLSILNDHQWNFSQLKQLASKFKNND